MKRGAWCAWALMIVGAHVAAGDDGFGYPDWIRIKDSIAVRCRVLSESDDAVEVIMSGGQGEEKVTIDRSQIEWLQRKSTPGSAQRKGGGTYTPDRRP